jgi:hypothetical protein
VHSTSGADYLAGALFWRKLAEFGAQLFDGV